MRTFPILLLLLIGPAADARAQSGSSGGGTASLSYGAEAAATANNRALGNFPLPLLYHRQGDWKVTAAPFSYKGSPSGSEYGERSSGSMKGSGGVAAAAYGLSDDWGVWGLLFGSGISGDLDMRWTSTTGGTVGLEHKDIQGSYLTGAFGLSRRWKGNAPGRLSLPFFFGLMVTKADFKQSVKETGPPGGNTSDFDMSGSGTSLGLVLGIQGARNLSRRFMLNPYLVLGTGTGIEFDFKVDRVRSETGTGTSMLDRIRAGNVDKSPADIAAFGVNLVYKPLGLAVNVLAPLTSNLTLVGPSFKTTILSMSYSFGRYEKG